MNAAPNIPSLSRGDFYRVWARVPVRWQESVAKKHATQEEQQKAIEKGVDRMNQAAGFGPAHLVMQDPTNSGVFTILARWVDGYPAPRSSAAFDVYQVEEVEPPRQVDLANKPTLDVGLTTDDVEAISFALAKDQDPTRLGAMADAFDDDYPIVAALLHAKANLEATYRITKRPTSFSGSRLVDALRSASSDLGAQVIDMWGDYATVAASLPPTSSKPAVVPLAPLLARLERLPYKTRAIMLGVQLSDAVKMGAPEAGSGSAFKEAARAAVGDCGGGVRLLAPSIVRQLLPDGPAPVSNGAIKAQAATLKPSGTLIVSTEGLKTRIRAARSSGQTDVTVSLGRAEKLLNRQTWVRYYLSHKRAGLM